MQIALHFVMVTSLSFSSTDIDSDKTANPASMASASVQATFEGLKDQIARFHNACEGDCDDIAGLFSAMSGQRLPVQALYGIMGISPEFVNQARQSGKPVIATRFFMLLIPSLRLFLLH